MASVVVLPSSDPEVITIPSQGPQGAPGPPGADGAQGPPGPPGPPGSGGTGGASIYISDTSPVGAPDKSLWWESDSGALYVRYNDGNSSQWVIVAFPQPDPASFVQYYAQSPTSAQQQAARTNIGAAAGQVTVFAVGGAGSGTYNTPVGCKLIHIKSVGAGGGGGGGGPSSAGVGGNGGPVTFVGTGVNMFAGGGNGAGPIGNAGAPGGGASGGQINIPGANGSPSSGVGGTSSDLRGAQGATSLYLGGAGEGGWPGAAGGNGGCGAGGGGGSSSQVGACGAGGGGGAYCELWINNPVATYTWAVGAGGIGGTLGGGVSNCSAGGNGGPGLIVVEEFY